MQGGKRVGAGRPLGTGRYGEETKALRVPLSKLEQVKALILEDRAGFELPLYLHKVAAGFPSPAEDYLECKLDLNQHLLKHPAATFLLRAKGESMLGAGIHSGDILVVDRSLEAIHGKIVIAAVDGELTVKRLYRKAGILKLQAENPEYPDIHIEQEQDLLIWGVVTYVIHQTG